MVTTRLAHGPTGDGVETELNTGQTAHVETTLTAGPTAHVETTLEGS